MIKKDLITVKLMNSLHNICQTGTRWIEYTILVLAGLYLNQTLFSQDISDIKASKSGDINCISTTVTLKCNSAGAGTVYNWTGPSGYVSTAQNPVTAIPGEYTISITNPLTGITSTANVFVALDIMTPAEVIAKASGILTCNDMLTTLTGNSTTQGVVYEWQGPEGFTSFQKEQETSIPGIYLLTVTNPGNGCTSKTNVTVIQNIKPPEDVIATASGVLTCNIQKVRLTGTSSTKGVNYNWTGPGLNVQSPICEISKSDNYVLKVTDPVNGCSSEASVTVQQNIAPPAELVATVADTLTCKIREVMLIASSASEGTIFNWSGPKGFASSEHTLMTGMPGDYTLHAINPKNGCSASKKVTVIQDTAHAEIKVISSGMITCKADTVTLTCITSTTNLTYDWHGPDDFSSGLASPKISRKGTYYVEATKISNGCSATESTIVTENISFPEEVMATASGVISCATSHVKLTGKSSTDKVNFIWTGPDGFRSDLQEAVTKLPGKYTLAVIKPVNGCRSETSITVYGEVCEKK
jgi:hypothetical protein